ncbi:MAG TPA: lysophospholipid acyltransferase family protein [Micromonosporaceae bacterium]
MGFWSRFAVVVAKPPLTVLTRRDWRGMEHIPQSGGVIIVANHLSEFDPLVCAHFVYDAGRWPEFLAKSSLFKVKGLGPFLKACKQIPVYRGTVDAVKALDAAEAAVKAGEAVVVYPEGTTPKKGELWPTRGKTGAARLWLATGAPVVPVVMWGPQRLFDPRVRKLHLRPRTPVTVVAGPPIDLSKWAGATPSNATLAEITEAIMGRLRDMLTELLGDEVPPTVRDGDGGR